MNKTRLEAFSDGVIAIIITIMVLELKIPHDSSINALWKLLPAFASYVMSFIYVGIYWVNHHHLIHTVNRINGKIMWTNFGLLFSLSLIPFTTGWMGENHFEQLPVAVYSINLLLCAITFTFLQRSIMEGHSKSSKMIEALKKQERKGYLSLFGYIVAIPFAFYYPFVSGIIFALIAFMWVFPDKHIEEALKS